MLDTKSGTIELKYHKMDPFTRDVAVINGKLWIWSIYTGRWAPIAPILARRTLQWYEFHMSSTD